MLSYTDKRHIDMKVNNGKLYLTNMNNTKTTVYSCKIQFSKPKTSMYKTTLE